MSYDTNKSTKKDHPIASDYNTLPVRLHVLGTIKVIIPGYCGYVCFGGFIKTELINENPNYKFHSAYLITACLNPDIKIGTKINVNATLHTGMEDEIYYKNFMKPTDALDIVY